MPKSIPVGLTKEHVLLALNDLDSGIEHEFEEATDYRLVYNGKTYAPKGGGWDRISASNEQRPIARRFQRRKATSIHHRWTFCPCSISANVTSMSNVEPV